MTLGPDGLYYLPNKVSSMGNGFTFDLMTIVLLCLARVYDSGSTVFGDDIIIDRKVAPEFIAQLSVGKFKVNVEKTFFDGPFRESCGANYLDGYGYLTSFDFHWLVNDHDLVVTLNKVAILASELGEPYESLRAAMWSCVPRTMLGAAVPRHAADSNHTSRPPSYELDTYVRYGPLTEVQPSRKPLKFVRSLCNKWQLTGAISVAYGLFTKSNEAPSRLRSCDWDLFYQNLSSGRRSKRLSTVVNKSTLVARVGDYQIGVIMPNSRESEV